MIGNQSRYFRNEWAVKLQSQKPRNRIGIVSEAICGCGNDYETVDHLLWDCPLLLAERTDLLVKVGEAELPTSFRNLLAQQKWDAVQACISCISSILTL
jgi:hypothetical protein